MFQDITNTARRNGKGIQLESSFQSPSKLIRTVATNQHTRTLVSAKKQSESTRTLKKIHSTKVSLLTLSGPSTLKANSYSVAKPKDERGRDDSKGNAEAQSARNLGDRKSCGMTQTLRINLQSNRTGSAVASTKTSTHDYLSVPVTQKKAKPSSKFHPSSRN